MRPLDEFVTRWNAVDMPVPFVETVNVPPEADMAVPDAWGSALLHSEQRSDVTMGSTPWVEERGTIIVGLLARSGSGREVLDAATEALREAFHGYVSADYTVQFLSVIGPEDIDAGEATGEWWRLGFQIPYVVQGRRIAPPPDDVS